MDLYTVLYTRHATHVRTPTLPPQLTPHNPHVRAPTHLRWLIHLYHNNINGILADEMGLGKTVQAIGMIAYLAEQAKGNKSCVIVPKSVVSNWMKEFAKWLPSLRVLMIGGTKEERAAQLKDVKAGNFDVIVTSFEVVTIEKAALKKIQWRYMVIDEAHRIKNENSLLSQVVREFNTHSRLLLTGTPLQVCV